MTTEEFSDEFDTLLNSHSNTESFGKTSNIIELDEYEKSVYLTKAQEELLISLYNGRNHLSESFEQTEELRKYLSDLVISWKTNTLYSDERNNPISKYSRTVLLPNNEVIEYPRVWYIIYEQVTFEDEALGCLNGTIANVVPVSHDDIYNILRNPFKGPSKKRVLRLDLRNAVLDQKNPIVELISKYNIKEYLVRYIGQPTPIILTDLGNTGLSINGITEKTECSLHPALHRVILDMAVGMAISSKGKSQ